MSLTRLRGEISVSIKPRRKGQVWIPDVLMSAVLFVVLIILYFQFSSNLSTDNRAIMETLVFDADIISETLLSRGHPPGWDENSVQQLGITDGNHRLNITKLGYVANLSYYDRKFYLGTVYEYYMVLQHTDGTLLNITNVTGKVNIGLSAEGGMGKPDVILESIPTIENPDHMVRTERYLIYNSTTIKLITYLWA